MEIIREIVSAVADIMTLITLVLLIKEMKKNGLLG